MGLVKSSSENCPQGKKAFLEQLESPLLEIILLEVLKLQFLKLKGGSVPQPEKCGPSFQTLRRTLLASLRQDAAAQRQAQEGNVQGQEGAEAGHAGGPAADHHGGAAHAGRGRAPDRGVRVRGHAPRHHRMSAGGGLPQQAAEARRGKAKERWPSCSEIFLMLSSEQEHPVFSGL
ncbi:single-pass membrane and coiled-coil domain-containing protein 4 [Vulpes lagopus]|uniref:single-pass membrane and coiled-coil domain-containing protein 4 n=1 Tax=Vulpes lagopus TaxID=494514 RepID=UPI001BC93A87|nr:single-pass membrane and coiled-coil domain-containing protein 4 [Vulpes lagopus]